VRVEGWLADMQEMSLEHLGDIKAASIAEWVAIDVVRRAIQKHFKSFLMTYTDENGQSVYGQRIKHLGESESCPRSKLTDSQL
jgi:DNA replication licensing factor MCM2